MTSIPQPRVLVLVGPNGAASPRSQQLVHDQLGIANFVNADTIARGLSAFEPADARGTRRAGPECMSHRVHE